MPNIYLPGAIWRRLVSCDGFGCFVRCDREEARVDAVLRTLQKHLRCTHCTAAAAFHTTGSHRASRRRWGRDLDRFGLSRYFLSPAQWNIIWGDKAGITHNFLVFSSEQHSVHPRGSLGTKHFQPWPSAVTALIHFHECNMRLLINVAESKHNENKFEQTNQRSAPVNYHARVEWMRSPLNGHNHLFVC